MDSIISKTICGIILLALLALSIFGASQLFNISNKDDVNRIVFKHNEENDTNYYELENNHTYKFKNNIIYDVDTQFRYVGECVDLYNFYTVSCDDKNADGIVSKQSKHGEIILLKKCIIGNKIDNYIIWTYEN